MENYNKDRKKFIITVLSIIIIPIIIAITAYIIFKIANALPRIKITNINEYSKQYNINSETVAEIENSLYNVTALNSENIDTNKNTAIIRSNSFTYEHHDDTNMNSITFIADIESLRQSYRVNYEWPDKNSDLMTISEFGTISLCLEKNELIYDDFNCKDVQTTQAGTNDPIIKILPHTVKNEYSVYYIKDYKGGINQIHIDIYACIDKQADPIEEEARAWLKENIQNLNNYKVTVSYCK